MRNPFAANTPSVFVVASPFQVLCAIAAIRQLEIKKYMMIAYLPKREKRNTQVVNLLEKNNIKYISICYCLNRLTFPIVKLIAKMKKKRGYSRLFVGDIRNMVETYIGLCLIKDGADIVYLDDGNPTIALLNDSLAINLHANDLNFLEYINTRRIIHTNTNLLTIYADIPNPKYNIKELLLNKVVIKKNKGGLQKDVFIVGTYLDSYSNALSISENFYIYKLGELMESLRNQFPKEDNIYFIPHGRETKEYGEMLCKKYGCIYRPSKVMIELELLDYPYIPRAIFGFTSAALYTLKKLFQDTRVVNVLFDLSDDTPMYREYLICSDYFIKNGIELMKVSS